MKRRLQNKIAESKFTFPIAAVISALLWLLTLGEQPLYLIISFCIAAFTTYLLMLLAAKHSLLRIRSQLIPSIFVLLISAWFFLHSQIQPLLSTLCFALVFLAFFKTYEKPKATTQTLHTYLILSVASIIYTPLIWFSIILLFCQGTYLRSLSGKTFGAAIIGLIIPWWIRFCVCFSLGDITTFFIVLKDAIPVHNLQEQYDTTLTFWSNNFFAITQKSLSASFLFIVYILILQITGYIHYLRKNYDDKIEVRMYYYTFLAFQFIAILFILLLPNHSNNILPLLILFSVPTIARFFASTRTSLTNIWFIICCIMYIALLIFHLQWQHF